MQDAFLCDRHKKKKAEQNEAIPWQTAIYTRLSTTNDSRIPSITRRNRLSFKSLMLAL